MPIDFATSLTVKHNFHFGPTLGAIVVFSRLALWGSFTTTTAITSNDKILNYSHGHQLECSSGWHQSSSSSSRELVGYTRRLYSSTRRVDTRRLRLVHVTNSTIHILLGIHLQANTYLNTQSPAYIHIYFWEYTSREMRVIDTITGNSQTHIHSHRLTYIFWEWPSREIRVEHT
ncbi:hypothetical protein DPMN_065200 [Dreissena polymorpha]|uniref:Uncharacterized protein n=1 Tax=Dreissena polymorpha TaxID=45954 RepID=A0A9D4CEK4_DREPO|nr:hypothetical protein DPMN_065200 [Dreissena polymorpha]